MEIEYIIVQAGGKGTRLEHLTKNKPKAIVPVHNLPILFHLFRNFKDKNFIIISDYKKDVLRKYLNAFADVKFILVDAEDATGTCAGIKKALEKVPSGKPFMLMWSDLILPEDFQVPQEDDNYIGISKDFRCRWSYIDNQMVEEPSYEYGIAGLFVFKNKNELNGVRESGEFVRWLQQEEKTFKEIGLTGTKEFGVLDEYNKLQAERCRPFNKLEVHTDRIVKDAVDEQGRKLAIREKNWYQFVIEKGYRHIPKIYNFEPFTMEKIRGKNVFEYDFPYEKKKEILTDIVKSLKELHSLEHISTDYFSMKEAYISKTFSRLNKVRDLIPFADQKTITVNGRECRNVFFFQEELDKRLEKLKADKFCLIHGDCTFSNIMLQDDNTPVLIDPRGYFGFTEIYGDAAYDWAKLYYSIVGNYDKFNLKEFKLDLLERGVTLTIASNGWEEMESAYLELLSTEVKISDIKLIHAIIWLSLTTYAWQDYDSICGAFYNGLFYLEESYD